MRLVIIGYGYSSRAVHHALGDKLGDQLESVVVTTRTAEKAGSLSADGVQAVLFDGTASSAPLVDAMADATHLLMSAAPGEAGDPFLLHHMLKQAPKLAWAGYLSTVGVYGDHNGAWVDETAATRPVSKRSIMRVAAEEAWAEAGEIASVPMGIYRLAGIYGPGRSALDKVRAGTARRIVKPGQVFNRIHVEDIGRVVAASALQAHGGLFNVTDDEPCPPQDVVAHACALLGVDPPPEIAFDDADLSPMGRSFYGENKRVSNAKIKQLYGAMLYPTYREGLAALV